MFLRTVANIARFSLLLLPVALLAAVSCGGGGDSGGKGGSTGTAGSTGSAGRGGSTGTAGATGTAGTTGTGGGPINCTVGTPTAADVTILDWNTFDGVNRPAFGGYMAGTWGGGTFEYPAPAAGSACDPAIQLCASFTGMNWHITGTVREYAGFGIYLAGKSDLSMFMGLQYEISGTFTGTGVGDGGAPAASLTMSITDTPHEVDSAHTANSRMTCGTCAPSNGSEYDGTCGAPSKAIPLTGTLTPTTVRWNDLTGGRRPPSFTGESPDPAQITAIAWSLPWSGTGSAQYTVDITIDNLKFLTQ